MYNAKVYRIMIGAPSDIKDEIQMTCEAINHWNSLNSERYKIVLLPLHWSTNSYPSANNRPQKFLNEQLVEKSDLLVCVFGTRIGTPTGADISGTVEEFNEHIRAGKGVMMFFKQSADNISSLDLLQFQKLNDFKNSIKDSVLWCDYQNSEDFKNLLIDKLQLYINDKWVTKHLEVNTSLSISESLSVFDKERLVKWSEGDGEGWIMDTMDGRSILLGDTEYTINNAKEKADWNAFFEKMIEIRFAQIDRYDKWGNPVYILTQKGFDYIEQMGSL